MCWRASCKNVSREQRLRRLAGLAGDGIPSLTGANRAEARCSRTYQPQNEFRGGRLESSLKFVHPLPCK